MKEKTIFWYMAAPAYHGISKMVKNHILRKNWIFRHTCCINNSHWQSSGIIIFLCKYYVIISDKLLGSFLDVHFLLLAVILSGLHEKSRRNKDWVTEKNSLYIKEIVRGTWLFWLHGLFSISFFVAFFELSFCSFCSFLQVRYLLSGP